jgi:hypothetical protein
MARHSPEPGARGFASAISPRGFTVNGENPETNHRTGKSISMPR